MFYFPAKSIYFIPIYSNTFPCHLISMIVLFIQISTAVYSANYAILFCSFQS